MGESELGETYIVNRSKRVMILRKQISFRISENGISNNYINKALVFFRGLTHFELSRLVF
jgi:hypothetical protein